MRAEEVVLTSPRLLTGKAAEARPELSLPAPSSPPSSWGQRERGLGTGWWEGPSL